MNSSTAFRISAVMGFLAVALGAFGAHGLKTILMQHDAVGTWTTAASYHLIHSVVLLLLASRAGGTGFPLKAWAFFLAGILLFSGSLYLLALTGYRFLGPITPIGGVCLLVGWASLIFRRS